MVCWKTRICVYPMALASLFGNAFYMLMGLLLQMPARILLVYVFLYLGICSLICGRYGKADAGSLIQRFCACQRRIAGALFFGIGFHGSMRLWIFAFVFLAHFAVVVVVCASSVVLECVHVWTNRLDCKS